MEDPIEKLHKRLKEMENKKDINELAAENRQIESIKKDYIDIENPITREIHILLNDDSYDLHETNRDSSNLDAGWIGYISPPLPKNSFRAAIEGMGLCQVIDNQLVSRLNNNEFVFIKRIGGRSVF